MKLSIQSSNYDNCHIGLYLDTDQRSASRISIENDEIKQTKNKNILIKQKQ